jgi:ubiquinone biosynthesis accessory factor UbiK
VQLQIVTHHLRAVKRNRNNPAVLNSKFTEDTMLDPKTLEEFGAKISALLANSPAKDIEKNAKMVMSGFFAKLDLVTREEFDIQAQVLARTREKLKDLEARVDALEKARSGQ